MFSDIEKMLLLKPVRLFSCLSGEELLAIAQVTDEVSFGPGATIFHEGDPGDYLYIIVRGNVQVLIKNVEINRLSSGSAFGEIALLDGAPRTASACSVDYVELLRISYPDFQDILEENAAIAKGINREMVLYTRQLTARLNQLKQENTGS